MRRTHHGVRLTATSLPVCENSTVISLYDVFYQIECAVIVHLSLERVFPKHIVKEKVSWWVLAVRFHQGDLAYIGNVLHDSSRAPIEFLLVHWPCSHHDLYRFRSLRF